VSTLDGLKEQVKAAMSRLERELIVKGPRSNLEQRHARRPGLLLKISRKGLQLKMKELGLREAGRESRLVRRAAECCVSGSADSRARLPRAARLGAAPARAELRSRAPPSAPAGGATPSRAKAWFGSQAVRSWPGPPEGSLPRIADEEMPGEQIILKGYYIDLFPVPPTRKARFPLSKRDARTAAQALLRRARQNACAASSNGERACKGPDNRRYEYGETYPR